MIAKNKTFLFNNYTTKLLTANRQKQEIFKKNEKKRPGFGFVTSTNEYIHFLCISLIVQIKQKRFKNFCNILQ